VSRTTHSASPSGATQRSRAATVLIRIPIIALTIILILIAFQYAINLVQTAAAAGIAFTSCAGFTMARVGFVAFPLTFIAFFLSCLFSPQRIVLALRTELILLLTDRLVSHGIAAKSAAPRRVDAIMREGLRPASSVTGPQQL
jgi:hypothetical protein